MTEPVVVKLGGSLFDLPDLGTRLESWLRALDCSDVILVAGGGAAADVIRAMDRVHGLGEEKSHWLAVESLGLTTSLLMALMPPTLPLYHLGDPEPAAQPSYAVQDLYSFARWDEGRPGCLPHRWDVTSDSLAARVAEVIGEGELVLLKSVTIPPEMDWAEASRRGFVDGYFPTMIARGVKARAVNLREWRP
jgi:5-(aminomethyl)-3-furanmethanol phosphate kinase